MPQVFHELARHLQTRRLIAGDTLQLDQDKNFYCVVDGLVQVYARSGEPGVDDEQGGAWMGEDLNGYHLLNEVGSGGTLSSLFTILSLFTENVHLAWPDPDQEVDEMSMPVPDTTGAARPDTLGRTRANSEISQLDLTQDGQESDRRLRDFVRGTTLSSASISSGTSTVRGAADVPRPFPASRMSSQFSAPPVSERSGGSQYDSRSQRPQPSRQPTMPSGLESVGGSVARASVDTTLAVIPAGKHTGHPNDLPCAHQPCGSLEAFRRLTSKFPKSSAHIIQ